MADRKKGKKKGQSDTEDAHGAGAEEDKPNKLEYAVAKYIKDKAPAKRTKFLNHPVNYFNANKAIDVLLESQWATGPDPIFTDRASVVEFGNRLLQLKFFHRAKKIAVTDKDLTPQELKKKKEREEKKKSLKNDDEKNSDGKKKKKVRLDMHLEQVFVDSSDAYVWMYDPIPFWYYIAGGLLLCTAVLVCLFPLWPPIVRQGVYYLSLAAAGFLGVILGLAVLRFIIFITIWMLSVGRHHFWILPNLTEDVGFFASFWPLYYYQYKGATYSDSTTEETPVITKKGRRKNKKVKIDDEAIDSQSAIETDKPETDADRPESQQSEGTESEGSNSQTFEMVNKDECKKDK